MNLDRINVRRFLEEAVREVPDQPFLIWKDEPVSYAEFDQRVNRAACLWREIGVRKGDRVAFMVDNSPEFLEAWLGLAKIGAVLNAVNTGFQFDEALYQVEHSEPVAALVGVEHAPLFERIADRLPSLRVLHLGEHPRFENYLARIPQMPDTAPEAELVGSDLISLIYTSGTTGRPKAVMQSHRNYVLTGQSYPAWLDIHRGDRLYVCLPYFHVNSQAYSTMGAIGARATIVLAPRFSASRFWDEVRRHRVTHFNFIGAMTVILARRERTELDHENAVRVAYGGTKLPYDVQQDVERRFGLKMLSGFGMSETTFGMVEDIHGYRRPGSIGKPRQHPDSTVPRNEARLVDDAGLEVGPDETGELLLRNPAMFSGYLKDPQRTAAAMQDGWLHTGDLLRRDEEGFYFFVDRKKDIIRRRGENISSVEVERTLQGHPAIRYAAAVGVPSELTDDEVMAFLVPSSGSTIDPDEVLAWCTKRIARFKVPRYLCIVDQLPRTGSHKVRKEELRRSWRRPETYDAELRGYLGTSAPAAGRDSS